MIKEIWRPTYKYSKFYEISNLGNVRSYVKGAIPYLLSPFQTKQGYWVIKLGFGEVGKQSHFTIHRLKATAFIPNPNKYKCINHKDGDKSNNDLSNLEWCSHSQNYRHAVENGLLSHAKGEYASNSKLTEKQVLEIFVSNLGSRELSRLYKIDNSAIIKIKSGENWNWLTKTVKR